MSERIKTARSASHADLISYLVNLVRPSISTEVEDIFAGIIDSGAAADLGIGDELDRAIDTGRAHGYAANDLMSALSRCLGRSQGSLMRTNADRAEFATVSDAEELTDAFATLVGLDVSDDE